jgi:hypothetical protein
MAELPKKKPSMCSAFFIYRGAQTKRERIVMKALRTLCISLLLPLLISACSTAKYKESQPPNEFAGMSLSKSIEKGGNVASCREFTTSFTTDDSEVISLLRFKNISGMHYLRWEWYAPKGELYYATDNYPIGSSEGTYRKELTAWHKLSISGDKAASYPGQWQVKAYMDDNPLIALTFSLKLTDLENIVAMQKPFPTDWALVIGIEEYGSLPRVDYAKRDALLVKSYFNKLLGVPENNIITLINKDATKSKIEGFIKQYLPKNVTSETTLYVYFAGHGAPDIAKGEAYLIPYDGDTRFLDQSGYNLKNFYQDLNTLKVRRVYIFIDSCFSGVAARSSQMLVKGARLALSHVQNPSITSEKIISINATNEAQVSNSYDEKKHGLFTYYLLNGLRGAASNEKDKRVSVKELYAYVLNNVSREAHRKGSEQTPTIMPAVENVKDMAISRPRQ